MKLHLPVSLYRSLLAVCCMATAGDVFGADIIINPNTPLTFTRYTCEDKWIDTDGDGREDTTVCSGPIIDTIIYDYMYLDRYMDYFSMYIQYTPVNQVVGFSTISISGAPYDMDVISSYENYFYQPLEQPGQHYGCDLHPYPDYDEIIGSFIISRITNILLFNNNWYSIYVGRDGAIELTNNSSIEIYNNKAETASVYNKGTLIVQGNRQISIRNNIGGGINNTGTATFSDNAITISGNQVTEGGGISIRNNIGGGIYNTGTATFSGNAITISGNQAAEGGGIYNAGTMSFDKDTLLIENNKGGGITNKGDLTISGSESVAIKGNTGNGIDGTTITLTNNSNVEISGNSLNGVELDTVTWSGNDKVVIKSNTLNGLLLNKVGSISGGDLIEISSNGADGIQTKATLTISNSGDINIKDNTGNGIAGSAISMTDNEDLIITGNKKNGISLENLTLSDNGAMTFSGNTQYGINLSNGGTITDNGDITASNNGSDGIYAKGDLSIRESGIGSTASLTANQNKGAGIKAGSLNLCLYDNVTAEGNGGAGISATKLTIDHGRGLVLNNNKGAGLEIGKDGGKIYDLTNGISATGNATGMSNGGTLLVEFTSLSLQKNTGEGLKNSGEMDITAATVIDASLNYGNGITNSKKLTLQNNSMVKAEYNGKAGFSGGELIAVQNSAVSFSANNNDGLNVTTLSVVGSTYGWSANLNGGNGMTIGNGYITEVAALTAENNEGIGISVSGKLTLADIFTLKATGNKKQGIKAATLLLSGSQTVSIADNLNGGIALTSGGQINNCSTLTFSENTAQKGGGLNVTGDLDLLNNTDVIFRNNTASIATGFSAGGALYTASGSSTCIKGTNVTFEQNYAGDDGGAIYLTEHALLSIIDNKGTVSISNNEAELYNGGAIFAYRSDIQLTGNKTLNITNNTSGAGGGAIYGKGANIYIAGNDSVTFRGNLHSTAVCGSANVISGEVDQLCALNAIYAEVDPHGGITLSADEGKTIYMYDPVVIRASINGIDTITTDEVLHLNLGESAATTGTILFSGQYAEADLKAAYTRAGLSTKLITHAELEASRTSALNGKAVLYGGTLKISDNACLSAAGMDSYAGSAIQLQNGGKIRLSNKGTNPGNSRVELTEASTGANISGGVGMSFCNTDTAVIYGMESTPGVLQHVKVLATEPTHLTLSNLSLSGSTSVNGGGALLTLDGVSGALQKGKNTAVGIDSLASGSIMSDGTELSGAAGVMMMSSSLLNNAYISGCDLTVDISDFLKDMSGYSYVGISFENTELSTEEVNISATYQGNTLQGITLAGRDNVSAVYFRLDAMALNSWDIIADSTNTGINEGETLVGNVLVTNGEKYTISGRLLAETDTTNPSYGYADGSFSIVNGTVVLHGQGAIEGGIHFLGDGHSAERLLEVKRDALQVKEISIAAYSDNKLKIDEDFTLSIDKFTGSGTLDKEGTGILRLVGDSESFIGKIAMNEGTIHIANNATLGSGILELTNGHLVADSFVLKQARSKVVFNGGSAEGEISLQGGQLELQKDSVFDGNLTIGGGTLSFLKNNSSQPDPFQVFAANDGESALNDTAFLKINGSIDLTGATIINLGEAPERGTYTLMSFDSWTGNIGLLSVGGLENTGLNYSFSLDDNVLSVTLSGGIDLYWASKRGIWTDGGVSGWQLSDNSPATKGFAEGTHAIFKNAATVTIDGKVSPGCITVDCDKNVAFKTKFDKKSNAYSGEIIGKGNLTKTGKGTLTLNAGNPNWQGNTYLKEGIIKAGGDTAFGSGVITVTGGTLDLASKAVANDIELADSATIKGGKKYLGTYTQTGGELMKGSVLNVVESATISGGVVNGTLSGLGMVTIDGDVALGTTGKITTSGLKINGDLSVSSKGLGMNSKTSAIEVNGGSLTSAGKLSAYSLTMTGGELTVSNAKPVSVSLKGGFMASSRAVIDTYGALSAASLDLQSVTFTMDMADEFVTAQNAPKAQSISLKDKYAVNRISNSVVNIGGKMSVAGNLEIDGVSQLHLYDPSGKNRAQSLTVKGSLNFGGVSSLRLNGALSAKDLTLGSGSLTVSNPKPMSVSLKGGFMASSGAVIDTYGALSAASLDLQGVMFTMDMADEFVTAQNAPKAQSISLKDKYAVNRISNNSVVNIGGKMSVAGNLEIDGVSQLHLYDPSGKNRAQSLAVKGGLNFGGGSSLRLNGALSAKDLTLGSGTLALCGAKLSTIKVSNSLTLNGGTMLNLGFNVTEKDVAKGKAYKIFTFKTIDPSITDDALNERLRLGTDAATLAFDKKRKAITLTVTDAAAWNAYAEYVRNDELVVAASEDDELVVAASEDDELVESADAQVLVVPATVDPLLGKVADTLVQSTWGTVGASRAFADTIAARGTHATTLANGKGAAWISTMGGSSRLSADGGHAGADYTLTGAAFGMETRLSEQSTIGLAIGNSWGKVSTFSAYPVDADSTHQGIYGMHILGSSTTLSWMAAHTRTESDANLAGMACDWTQDALQLDARVDKLFAISDRTTVSAFVGMQYLATDKGECNGMSTGSLQNLRGEIGVSAAHKATDKAYVYGELSFIGDMVRHNPTATVGDYRSRGANPGRAGLNLGVGGSYRLNDSWSLNASYNLELMQNRTSHSANVGATYSF